VAAARGRAQHVCGCGEGEVAAAGPQRAARRPTWGEVVRVAPEVVQRRHALLLQLLAQPGVLQVVAGQAQAAGGLDDGARAAQQRQRAAVHVARPAAPGGGEGGG
jgi:hypothetical protein